MYGRISISPSAVVSERHWLGSGRPLTKRGLLASLRVVDELLRRRRYTQTIVAGFYKSARRGQAGETAFVRGLEALSAHGYRPDAVESLPLPVAQRFLGLGSPGTHAPGGPLAHAGHIP